MWCWICYFRPIMALDSTIITRMDKSWKYAKIQRDQSGRIVKQIVRTSIASVDLYSAARDVGASCSVVLIRSNRQDKTVYGNPRKASRTTDGAQINWLTTLWYFDQWQRNHNGNSKDELLLKEKRSRLLPSSILFSISLFILKNERTKDCIVVYHEKFRVPALFLMGMYFR